MSDRSSFQRVMMFYPFSYILVTICCCWLMFSCTFFHHVIGLYVSFRLCWSLVWFLLLTIVAKYRRTSIAIRSQMGKPPLLPSARQREKVRTMWHKRRASFRNINIIIKRPHTYTNPPLHLIHFIAPQGHSIPSYSNSPHHPYITSFLQRDEGDSPWSIHGSTLTPSNLREFYLGHPT